MRVLLTTLALVAGLAIACGGNDDDANSAGSLGSTGSTGAVGAAPTGPDVPDSGAPATDSSVARLVVTSNLSLEVIDLRVAYQRTVEVTRSVGGFVADGRISSSTDGADDAQAALRLRVPYEQHDRLLEGLRGLGSRITHEETATTEVTGEYTDLQSRVVNLRRSEAQYQSFLERSGTIEEVLDVAARLDEVRGEIEQIQGRINLLADQSDFATVSVSLALPPVPAQAGTGGASGLPSPVSVFGDALAASFEVAHALVNVSAVLLVLLLWGIPASVAFVMLRRPVLRLIAASKSYLS